MNKEERLKKLIEAFENHGITSYEASQNTSLSINGVNKIITGQSKNPRESNLKELENFVSQKLGLLSEIDPDEDFLRRLEIDVVNYWEILKERKKAFYLKIQNEKQNAIINELKDFIQTRKP